MALEYSARAVADLHRIADYHARLDDAHVGARVAARLREVIERVERLPESGRPVDGRPGTHVVLLLPYRYKLFYKTTGEIVRILHIRHTSRRPWPAD